MVVSRVVVLAVAGCGRLRFDAVADAVPVAIDAEAPSCLPSPLVTPVYATATFADFATVWATGGSGTWTTAGGQLVQSDPTVGLAYAYFDPGLTDYRVVSNATIVDDAGTGSHAIELALRVDGANMNMYECNWDPIGSGVVINATMAGLGTAEFTRITITPPADPTRVVMEAQIVGTRIECCLAGLSGAYASVIDARFTTGMIGVKTFFVSGAFDHLQVFR